MISLEGKRFLILNGCSGIGIAIASRAVQAGADLTITSTEARELDTALAVSGISATDALLDLEDDAAVARFFADPSPWDHVVVSARQMPTGATTYLDVGAAYAAMEARFWSAYRVARAVKITPGGSLTLISDSPSVRTLLSSPLQKAINAALDALAQSLALERAPVRVNAISPGVIAGPPWLGMSHAKHESMLRDAASRLPAGRVGQPEEVADAVLFLATARFISGVRLQVDGGGAAMSHAFVPAVEPLGERLGAVAG
jgi:NAD(P)-dependent dehydrogenase (short-subunit alcohol dehydrogenase family)